MRPQAKANAAGEARARMYMRRDLAWLDGFPGEGNTWVVAPLGEAVSGVPLDGELLHRSTRTINMLVREFPRALPRLVGDVEVWAERRKALMELVKRSVHDGESLPLAPTDVHPLAPASLKKKVAAARGALRPLSSIVAAFEWSGWTSPEGVGASLAWLQEHDMQIGALTSHTEGNADVLCFRLWQLSREHGKGRVAPLLTFLAQPEIWTHPLECKRQHVSAHSTYFAKRKKDPNNPPPTREEASLPTIVTDWVLWLATQDARTQRKGLELFPLLVEGRDASDWASWWKRFDRVVKDASRIPEAKKKKDPNKKARLAVVERFAQLGDETPPALPAKVLSELLRGLPTQEQDEIWKSLQSGLEHWPATHDGAAIRVAMSHHWLSIWRHSTRPERAVLLRLIAQFHSYARDASFDADALMPWSDIWVQLQGRLVVNIGIDHDILEELRSREKLETFFRVLRETGTTTGRQAELLVKLCATFPKASVTEAYIALRGSPVAQSYIPDSVLKFAASIASDRAAHLPKLLTALLEHQDRYDEIGSSLRAIHLLFENEGFPDLILMEIEEGRMNAVAAAAFRCNLVLREGGTIPKVPRHGIPDSPLEWAERYPAELQAAIARLAEFDEQAPKTAQRILTKDFPDPDALRRELATLENPKGSDGQSEEPSEEQRRRARSLRSRLDSPASPSSRRLARLGSKLSATVEQKALHGWMATLSDAYQSAVRSYLKVEAAPSWLEDARVVRALLPMVNLEQAFQTLAKTLLRVRAGAEPWDLRDDPRNRTFLDTMERQGVRSEVWLADRKVAATTSDGRTLSLSLERDPLEIFHMGGHFNTCLAPGAFNYFSVIANAADINKQVLFARDSEGRVFGRQLLALTDDGGLLAFHCYAHSHRVGFLEIAKDFVTTLAEDMGTLVVASGRVSTLVAPRWYDDGPVDFASEHAALEEDSRFRRSLKKLDARQFLEATSAALSPLPLNELTLPRVLALPELSERPELAALLMPLAKRTSLTLSALVAFVETLLQADGISTDAAARWVHEAASREARFHDHWAYGAVELLLRIDPARALDVLRRTRSKDIRRWADDWDGWRLRLVARAHEGLHRRNKALEFYRLAMNANSDTAFKRECQVAMQRLQDDGTRSGG